MELAAAYKINAKTINVQRLSVDFVRSSQRIA